MYVVIYRHDANINNSLEFFFGEEGSQ